MGSHNKQTTRRGTGSLPCTIPDDVMRDGILWEPTWEEKRIDFHLQEIAKIHAELDRKWLEEARERSAKAEKEIDATAERLAAREVLQSRLDWFRSTAERTAAESKRLIEFYQAQLDGNLHQKMLDRSAKAAEDIRRTDARIERNELLRRGVVKGRRK